MEEAKERVAFYRQMAFEGGWRERCRVEDERKSERKRPQKLRS